MYVHLIGAVAALSALAALAHATELYSDDGIKIFLHNDRDSKAIDTTGGCKHEGRWHAKGASVRVSSRCLRCKCAGGALACARRACTPLPDPPPPRCHLLHRKDACCPELHCPDKIMFTERDASARLDVDDTYHTLPSMALGACVSDGIIYAAGSAMDSSVACEQCFCLGGARRCVRPRCLPSPPGCRPHPAPGACCPRRYYCQHEEFTTISPEHRPHDCLVNGSWVIEGERVTSKEAACMQCFCLRGAVRCQEMQCAPPLLGCTPLLRPGQCCPHQYVCQHRKPANVEELANLDQELATANLLLTQNSLSALKTEDRAMRRSDDNNKTQNIDIKSQVEISTNKVKRKTNDGVSSDSKMTSSNKYTKRTSNTDKMLHNKFSTEPTTTTELVPEIDNKNTEKSQAMLRVVVNGTINCTTEYSSTVEIPDETDYLNGNIDRMDFEEHTTDSYDVITDKMDDYDSFTINVTSSLHTNSNRSSAESLFPGIVTDLTKPPNITRKKDDYDYDYVAPTLPPSLPNLKIIPFVAADAVVKDKEPDDIPIKETITYPILEREDKFPIYYPKNKDVSFATRREDVYNSENYPILPNEPENDDTKDEGEITKEPTDIDYNLPAIIKEFTVSTSLGNKGTLFGSTKPLRKTVNKTINAENNASSMFSPPVETEGGFIPKGPGLIEEYYAVYPKTSVPPHMPHLTTSMQLDTDKGDCVSTDGRRIPEGESITLSCSQCACAWGELHCSPRPCVTPPGCVRKPSKNNASDLCCGELVCKSGQKKNIPESQTSKPKQKPTTTTTTTTTTPSTTTLAPIISTTVLTTSAKPNITDTTPQPSNLKTQTKLPLSNQTENTHLNISDISLPTFKPPAFLNNTETKITTTTEKENNSKKPVSTSDFTDQVSNFMQQFLTKITTIPPTTVKVIDESQNSNETDYSSEYEEDDKTDDDNEEKEEEDDGFSFGSVLKLLLSDNYESTTPPPKKKITPTTLLQTPTTSTTSPKPTTIKPFRPKPTVAPFIPLPPQRPLYAPPHKNYFQPSNVNRIDHLVLGEATAIKRTTMRPVTTTKMITSTFRPLSSTRPITTRKSFVTTSRPPETTAKLSVISQHNVRPQQASQFSSLSAGGMGPGLKLAGCNIYGQMYQIGKRIDELSNTCQECRCSEVGVQCRSLSC